MRAFHGQMSDNQPIRRTHAEKQKQLRDLRETLATMKSHTAPRCARACRSASASLKPNWPPPRC